MITARHVVGRLLETDPDEVRAKDYLPSLSPSAEHWLQQHRFIHNVTNRPDWWTRRTDKHTISVRPTGRNTHDVVVMAPGKMAKVYAELWDKELIRKLTRLLESGPDDVDPKEYLRQLPPRPPRTAYALLPTEMLNPTLTHVTPIIVKEGEPGYWRTDWSWRKEFAEAARDQANERLGLTPDEAEQVMISSMFPKQDKPKRKRKLKEGDPDDVDPKSMLMQVPSPYQSLESEIKPGDRMTAPMRVVLRRSLRRGEWVTRLENMQVGGEFWGHYHDDYEEALRDYEERCIKLGVSLLPARRYAEETAEHLVAKLLETDPDDLDFKSYSLKHGYQPCSFIRTWDGAKCGCGRWSMTTTDRNRALDEWKDHRERMDQLAEAIDPDDVDPIRYLKDLVGPDRRIAITFSRTTPESSAQGDTSDSGWIDEEGVEMNPDLYDMEEGVTAVDKAVKFLKDEGVAHPSSSQFHVGLWYSTDYQTVDHRTGEDEERCFHLRNFTPEEEEEIYKRVIRSRN